MTNDAYDPVPILVIAEDKAVEDGLLRQLSLWAEARCVRIRFLSWQGTDTRRPDPAPSLLFLYLQSGDGGPNQAPAWLEEVLSSCAVVILSEDQLQAIQAYQWHPAACLSIGFSYDDLYQAMDRCFRYWRQGLEWLDLPCQWERVRVPLSQLHYAEGQGRDTILHCAGGEMRASEQTGAGASRAAVYPLSEEIHRSPRRRGAHGGRRPHHEGPHGHCRFPEPKKRGAAVTGAVAEGQGA